MTRRRRFALGLALVDAPVLVAVAVVGAVYGYGATASAVIEWRQAHPWSYLPSLALLAVFAFARDGNRLLGRRGREQSPI